MPLTTLSDRCRPVGERAAVIVFRACQANTLETAYQLRDAGEFMLASQSIVPIAGIWPWGSFLAALKPGATSGEVARDIGEQLALFLETPANRGPFADVPYSLIDLGRRARDRRAVEGARRRARRGARPTRPAGRRARRPSRRRASAFPTIRPRPAIRRCSTCRRCARTWRGSIATRWPDRRGRSATSSTRRLVAWHRSQQGRHRGIGLYYRPVKPEHASRSHLYNEGLAEADADATTGSWR